MEREPKIGYWPSLGDSIPREAKPNVLVKAKGKVKCFTIEDLKWRTWPQGLLFNGISTKPLSSGRNYRVG